MDVLRHGSSTQRCALPFDEFVMQWQFTAVYRIVRPCTRTEATAHSDETDRGYLFPRTFGSLLSFPNHRATVA